MTNNSVLVIGAVLLDVIGHAASGQEHSIDKIGTVDFSVGGVAFNIAVNLTQLGFECQLFTCLKSESPISDVLKSSIESTGVKLDYLIEHDLSDGTFMAIHADNGMHALTSSPIDKISLFVSGALKRAISKSKMVIVDTNLSEQQIKDIHQLCIENNSELCVVSASDAKAARLRLARDENSKFALVGLNAREALEFGVDPASGASADEVRNAFAAQRVLLSRGEQGASFYDANGEHHLDAPTVKVVSDIGAGDAMFSALCACLLVGKRPYEGDGRQILVNTVSKVLGKAGPNMGDSRVSFGKSKERSGSIGLALMVLTPLSVGIGLSVGLLGVAEHWGVTLGAALVWGALGAWIFNRVRGDKSDHANITTGALVGLASVMVASLPNLAGGDLVDPDGFNKVQMSVHFVTSSIFALLAGLGLSKAVDRLMGHTL